MSKQLNPPPDDVLRAATDCHKILLEHAFPHVVAGGLAVYLHTDGSDSPRDVDLLVQDQNTGASVIGTLLVHSRDYKWDDFRRAVLHPNGVRIDVHWHGKRNRYLPYPTSSRIIELKSLDVLGLWALIESKLETYEGEEDTSKHWQHIRQLIIANSFNLDDVGKIQVKYRQIFLDCVNRALSEQ